MAKDAQLLSSPSPVSTLDLAPPKPWRRFVPSWLRSLMWVDSIEKYDAFLSYSWKSDSTIAPVIQSVIQKFLCPWYKFRAKSVFRDLSSLPAGSSLEAELCDRLDRSTHLIVLASPEAAASHGMEVEARHWFSRPREGQVLILISSGEFRIWEDGRNHLLPPTLAKNLRTEPLWISLQHRRERMLSNPDNPQLRGELTEDLKQLLLRLYDGHDWDQLRGQERVQRQRARWLVSGVILLLLALLGTAVTFWSSAREQRAQAELQRDKTRAQLLAIKARRADREEQSPNEIALAGTLAMESIRLAQKSNLAPEVDAIEVAQRVLIQLPLEVLTHGRKAVLSLKVLPDGRLASGSDDGTIKLWPKDGAGDPKVLTHGREAVSSLVVLEDGRLVSGAFDSTIKLWPKDGAGDPLVLRAGGLLSFLMVLADGRLASGDAADGTIKLWPKDGVGDPKVLTYGNKAELSLLVSKEAVSSLVVLADGRLVSGTVGGTIKLWPKDGGGDPKVLTHGKEGVSSLAVLADGRLASGGLDGRIKLWPRDGVSDPMVLTHGGKEVSSLEVLPDGRLVSLGDGMIKLWAKDGKGAPVVLIHGGKALSRVGDPVLDREGVSSLAVLADGRLASGGYDGTIKLWPKDGVGDPVVLIHGERVDFLTALPDGRLASGSGSMIKLWLVDEQKLIAALCLRVGRNLKKDEWVRYIGSDSPWQPSCRDLPSNWRTPD